MPMFLAKPKPQHNSEHNQIVLIEIVFGSNNHWPERYTSINNRMYESKKRISN